MKWGAETFIYRRRLCDFERHKYHYYLKDHQGNNQVIVSAIGSVEEMNHYYPFGGISASGGNVQLYKYNGKELDTKKES